MASPLFKFYVDGFLKQFNLEFLLRRNAGNDILNVDGGVLWAKTRQSPDDVAAEMASRLWIKAVDADTSELWHGSKMICRFDPVNGNLLFGFNDISTLPLEKGGTGYAAVGADDAAKLANLLGVRFGLKDAAFKESGLTAGKLLLLAEDNKLPALDGSLLTGIANIPIGMINWYATETPPTGYLKANGAQVSRTVYADLWETISDRYGNGNGTTTFTLPDLRGMFIRGWDDGRGVDTSRAFGSTQQDELKSHTHNLKASGGSSGPQNAVSIDANNGVKSGMVYATGGDETRPKNVALLPCIKY